MESRKITLICANHHDFISSKYFLPFRNLIVWDRIPDNFPQKIEHLSAEVIHTLIKISINSNKITKNLNSKQKAYVKLSIIGLLKKKYIIETFFGERCQICGEFNTKDHLVCFHFNHIDNNQKTILASDLYKSESITCTEIVKTLIKERGGYLCNNCHTVFHKSNFYNLLDKVYIDNRVKSQVFNEHRTIKKEFKIISNIDNIKNPFKLPKNSVIIL